MGKAERQSNIELLRIFIDWILNSNGEIIYDNKEVCRKR